MQYNTIQYHAMQSNPMQIQIQYQYTTIQYNGMQCNAIQYNTNTKQRQILIPMQIRKQIQTL